MKYICTDVYFKLKRIRFPSSVYPVCFVALYRLTLWNGCKSKCASLFVRRLCKSTTFVLGLFSGLFRLMRQRQSSQSMKKWWICWASKCHRHIFLFTVILFLLVDFNTALLLCFAVRYNGNIYKAWTAGVDEICKVNLNQPLINRNKDNDLITVNFDPKVNKKSFFSYWFRVRTVIVSSDNLRWW